MVVKLGEGINGWLSPTGHIYKCNHFGHYEKALQILSRLNKRFSFNIEKTLHMNQYVSLSSGAGMGVIGFSWEVPLTQAQVNWFKKHYDKLDSDQQECISMKAESEGWEIPDTQF